MIGSRLGSYEITAKIGAGGMGEVYRATDSRLKREVAIKVLPEAFTEDEERLSRFEREAQLLAQLNHPNIAAIHGVEEADGVLALVMELVEGPTLAERLEQGPLPLEESFAVALQIARALEEAHEKGIIHRDLKPQNVKAPVEGKVKVLDFGLAKAMDPAMGPASSAADLTHSPTLMHSPTLTAMPGTQQGVILGTAAYMSPEQAKGRPVDKRTDIWAFGVVLWEMLTGRRLFAAESVPETLAAIFSRDLSLDDLPESTPPAVRQLLGRCLERDSHRRLRDIGEARLVLESPDATALTHETTSPAASERPRAPAWLGWAAAALLAAVAVLLAVRDGSRAPRPELYRLVISSASGASIAPGVGGSAISPDGRRVVFLGSDTEGRQGLWVQELDQVKARLLDGTEAANFPFWAPDSRRIAFFAESELRKTSLDNGRIDVVADAIEGRGGSWSKDGTIVFAPAVTGPLFAVSESGGPPRQVTRIEDPEREQSHRFPYFLPDGRKFLYIADPGADTAEGAVYLASVDGSESRLLYRSRRAPIFAEPGYLIDAIDDRLVARAFDPESGELRGEPWRLEEATPRYVITQERVASVSDSGALLVPTATATQRSRLVWLDRQGMSRGEIPLPFGRDESVLKVSPDGGRIVLAGGAEEKDLWVVDVASESVSRLTFARGIESYPVWSPDGTRLAFQSDRLGVNDLWIRPSTAGGAEEQLFVSPTAWKQPGSWVGDTLAFVSTERETGFDIWLLHPDRPEEPPEPILGSPASELEPAISPDGRFLAYSSNESGRTEIYLVSLPDAAAKFQVTTEGGRNPVWVSGGRELLYLTPGNSIASVSVSGGVSPAIGAAQVLFPLGLASSAAFSEAVFDAMPDGSRIVLLAPQGLDTQTLVVVTDWQAELGGKVP